MELYEASSIKKITCNIKETVQTPNEEAEDAAKIFLELNVCDGGVNAPSVGKWNNFANIYALLSDEAKSVFVNAIANEVGTYVEKAVARYDYIITKYNASQTIYDEFIIGRSVDHSSSRNLNSNLDTNSSYLIILFSTICLCGVSGFAFYKKRKVKRKKNSV